MRRSPTYPAAGGAGSLSLRPNVVARRWQMTVKDGRAAGLSLMQSAYKEASSGGRVGGSTGRSFSFTIAAFSSASTGYRYWSLQGVATRGKEGKVLDAVSYVKKYFTVKNQKNL